MSDAQTDPPRTDPEPLVTRETVYTGRRRTAAGKTAYRYVELDTGDAYLYAKQIAGRGTIGAVYEMTESPTGTSVYTAGEHGPRYVRSLPYDDERVIEWKAADLAFATEQQRASAIRKAGDPFAEVEQLLAEAAGDLTRDQRRALAVRLLEVLYLA